MLKGNITSDDILGKDAVDKEGEIIGTIQQLHIDKRTKEITGITIDGGFMKPDIFVGIKQIKNFGIDSVFLRISPYLKITGLKVFDPAGREIGVVSDVDATRGNRLKRIHIKMSMIGKTLKVGAKELKDIGDNIILKKTRKEIIEEFGKKS